jgi:hypothetical protein
MFPSPSFVQALAIFALSEHSYVPNFRQRCGICYDEDKRITHTSRTCFSKLRRRHANDGGLMPQDWNSSHTKNKGFYPSELLTLPLLHHLIPVFDCFCDGFEAFISSRKSYVDSIVFFSPSARSYGDILFARVC